MKSSFNFFYSSTSIHKNTERNGGPRFYHIHVSEKYQLFIPSGFECMLKIIISFYHLLKTVKGEKNITDLLI